MMGSNLRQGDAVPLAPVDIAVDAGVADGCGQASAASSDIQDSAEKDGARVCHYKGFLKQMGLLVRGLPVLALEVEAVVAAAERQLP
jgi:hypothetical protein